MVRCREDDSKLTPICAGTKEDSWTFFLSNQTCAALLLCLFGGERQRSVVRPFLTSSPLSIVKLDVSEISKPPTRLPHPEKWQPWSLKMLSNKKEVLWAATHTAVFRRQRLGTTPSTQIFKQDDRFGAKRRRLLLWSVREHLVRVVQRSAFVSTDKLWLSRLSFFGMDYRCWWCWLSHPRCYKVYKSHCLWKVLGVSSEVYVSLDWGYEHHRTVINMVQIRGRPWLFKIFLKLIRRLIDGIFRRSLFVFYQDALRKAEKSEWCCTQSVLKTWSLNKLVGHEPSGT